jgi:hypothetical protein
MRPIINKVQCSGLCKNGERCKRTVSTPEARLSRTTEHNKEWYCHTHHSVSADRHAGLEPLREENDRLKLENIEIRTELSILREVNVSLHFKVLTLQDHIDHLQEAAEAYESIRKFEYVKAMIKDTIRFKSAEGKQFRVEVILEPKYKHFKAPLLHKFAKYGCKTLMSIKRLYHDLREKRNNLSHPEF